MGIQEEGSHIDEAAEAERKLLEQLAKKQKGKPGQRERHGANTWRHWLDDEESDD